MTQAEYFVLPLHKKAAYRITSALKSAARGVGGFFTGIPKAAVKLGRKIAQGGRELFFAFKEGDLLTKLTFVLMGAGNLFRGQIVKGLLFLAAEIAYFVYMSSFGWEYLLGLRNLGTVQRGWYFDEELGIDILRENGDNSMLILLYGILTVFVIITFAFLWHTSVMSAARAEQTVRLGKKLPKFKDDLAAMLDSGFHKTLLFLPAFGVVVFTVIPLVYMILIAFTNYDKDHQVPANLFTWTGIDNFRTMLGSGSVLAETFWGILGWTVVWAVFATFLNYILGIVLALLINKKGIKFKGFFRTLFVLAIAVPQFVSLLVMRNVLAEAGPLNVLLQETGIITSPLPFFTDTAWARVTVILVNLWIGIPHTMLITSGILLNIPDDLYEAAKIDGASPFVMFFRITMPYVIFVTTPYLITQFIGNINNFNVIYFLTGGTPATLDYYQAGKTDLLITWLYKLTVNSRDYCYASTIGILVFVICSVLSLITFRNSKSYTGEEAYQ